MPGELRSRRDCALSAPAAHVLRGSAARASAASRLIAGTTFARRAGVKHEERPFTAIWETTQACDLACRHCRAWARPERDDGELSTKEGFWLLRAFAAAKVPRVVLTGGDPAKRSDLVELVRVGASEGLHVGLAPSATPLVTDDLVRELSEAGLRRLAIGIDGPNPAVHDAFRGASGSFDSALRVLQAAHRHRIRTQVNTIVHAGSIGRLREIAALVTELGSAFWSVLCVAPTGRADLRKLPSPEAVEISLHEVAEIAETARFIVKTTAAPHYRRVLSERGRSPQQGVFDQDEPVNDGHGSLFVSHRGEIYPSGYLPISCGNVRSSDPIETYRHHPVFRALRDADGLTGKCHECRYRDLCGGSRARAYALTGSYTASDPLCAYVPPGSAEASL
jgi:radical SAM protein with 4Fe4S-binding SPASM domain